MVQVRVTSPKCPYFRLMNCFYDYKTIITVVIIDFAMIIITIVFKIYLSRQGPDITSFVPVCFKWWISLPCYIMKKTEGYVAFALVFTAIPGWVNIKKNADGLLVFHLQHQWTNETRWWNNGLAGGDWFFLSFAEDGGLHTSTLGNRCKVLVRPIHLTIIRLLGPSCTRQILPFPECFCSQSVGAGYVVRAQPVVRNHTICDLARFMSSRAHRGFKVHG